MKKTLIKLSALATIGLVMASCNNEEANKKAADADNAAIQTLVDTKTQAIDAEVAAACDAKVAAAAQLVVDSLEHAAKKGTAKPITKKAAPKPAPKPVEKPKGGLGDGKQGTQNAPPVKLGEGKQGTQNAPPVKLGEGKQGTQKP